MLEAILVDCDGTLIDTAYANAAAYAHALSELGYEKKSIEELMPLIEGRHWQQFLPLMLPEATPAELQKIIALKRIVYPNFFHLTYPNRILLDLLTFCKGHCKVAVVTTGSRSNIHALLSHHNILDYFDVLICSEDVRETKPSPEPYRKAAEILGIEADNCLIVEDSPVGITSATQFGGHLIQWLSKLKADKSKR